MVILGSTRAGRAGDKVMKQLKVELDKHKDLAFDYVDLRDLDLPFFDESLTPFGISVGMGEYANPKGRAWADRVGAADGYIIVTPEYDHGVPAVLKNAIDWVGKEWNRKPVSFVSYGAQSGGIRAVEQLRLNLLEVRTFPLHDAVHIPNAHAAFNEEGELLDERTANAFAPMVAELRSFLKSYSYQA